MGNKIIPKLPEGVLLNNTYTVGKCLGQGGFGITYIGYDVNLQRKVAIKEFFLSKYAFRNEFTYEVFPISDEYTTLYYSERNRFVDEGRILAKLDAQSGIVNVISYFEEFNTAYIVMEYIEGQALSDYVQQRGGWLPVDETLSIMEPVIKALAIIHQQGIVHRDISPDNIMLTANGRVKLIDFGAAKTKEMNMNSNRVAKLRYSPPEQCSPNGEIGTYSDIYAMCATLYELMGGCKMQDIFERMKMDRYMSLLDKGMIISPIIDAVITNGLEMEVDNRIKNATDLYYLLYVYGKDGQASPEGVKKKIKDSSTKVIVEKMKAENKKRGYIRVSAIMIIIVLLLGCGIILVRSINRKGVEGSASHTGVDNDAREQTDTFVDMEIGKEEIYECIEQERKAQGVSSAQVDGQFEDVCNITLRELCSLNCNSTDAWNEAISSSIKDNMADAGLSGAGWLVLPYTSPVSAAEIYADAMRNITSINGEMAGAIDLISCNKIGVASGVHSDGTLFVIFIFK